MNKHETHVIIQAIQEVASELGHAPSKREFTKHSKNIHHSSVISRFKTWSAAIMAAGLVPNEETQKKIKPKKAEIPKIDSEEEIRSSIESRIDKKIYKIPGYKKIIVFGDIHFPFCDMNALSLAYAIVQREKPDVIVQIGDLMDMYAATKFPRSLNIMTPRAEFQLARKQSEDFWKKLSDIVPNAKLIQCVGNHDLRALARVIERWPEGEDLVRSGLEKLFTFENVTTIFNPKEELQIGDIYFIHGYRSKLGEHAIYMSSNVVCGHSHTGGVFFRRLHGRTIWELNAGFLADPDSAALSYRAQKTYTWTIGLGIIDELGARFVPF